VCIGLLKPFREIGIGTKLMELGIDWALSQGLAKLTASTFSTNARALNLYLKMGFAITGVRYRQFRIDGAYVDQVLMERLL
jgi:RimJ/RimL family protein N-acetyltransferase